MSSEKRKKFVIVLVVLLCAGAALWGWNRSDRGIHTDNAYVHANMTTIAPKVAGYVTKVYVDDNAQIKAGDILFTIDERDYAAREAQAVAGRQAAQAAIAHVEASIALQHATIDQARAQLSAAVAVQKRMAQEYVRQTRLIGEKATTDQKFEEATSAKAQADASLIGAEVNLKVQRKQLDVLSAQLDSARASLAQTEAALELARLDRGHCTVRAPVDGVVGNRKARAGRYVTPGTTLLELVPVHDVWIVANFKETQLERIRPGQTANIRVDGYSGIALKGVVDSLAPGSGSAFSLMPPDNATGNFVRVVQRVPVKISLSDNTLKGRLVPGLSVRIAIYPD
jgi:membrane fusion protein (multidrug efflux system)